MFNEKLTAEENAKIEKHLDFTTDQEFAETEEWLTEVEKEEEEESATLFNAFDMLLA